MLNSNIIQKSSVSFKQPIGKNIESLFYQKSYGAACSHNPQKIITCNTNTVIQIMSTSPTNVLGKRQIVTPTSTRTLRKI